MTTRASASFIVPREIHGPSAGDAEQSGGDQIELSGKPSSATTAAPRNTPAAIDGAPDAGAISAMSSGTTNSSTSSAE